MLKIEHISKTFNPGTITEKIALRDVSLHLSPGEFVTVIGGNGAGKSTLMNSIAGTFLVDKGSLTIDGQDITKWPEHRRAKYIGRVFQDPMMGTAAGMMIEENLAIAARRGKVPSLRWSARKSDRQHLKELLSSLNLGLEDRLESKVGLRSGAQRQAISLLFSSMADPKLLLLDEHTAALDPKTAEQVLAITKNIEEQRHLTTLMITHNMRDALRCGNRLIMMFDGKILIDVKGEDKKNLTVKDLLAMFEKAAGSEMDSDSLLLS